LTLMIVGRLLRWCDVLYGLPAERRAADRVHH